MVIAYIGMGSNLGKRQTALRAAVTRLGAIPGTRLLALASFRETEPVDSPAGAARFINSAAAVETSLGSTELLEHLLRIERELGRTRNPGLKNAPRLIDLDLLQYGDLVLSDPGLTLPHPRMHQRRFVLEPLAEIAPEAVHLLTGKTFRELLSALDVERTPLGKSV